MTKSRIGLAMVLGGLVILATPSVSMAQLAVGRSNSPYGPTTSPYLNLLQNNSQLNPVSTYNTLVKPLIDQNDSLIRQGASLNRLQQQVNTGISAGGARGGSTTGHASYFMNYSHYYGMRR